LGKYIVKRLLLMIPTFFAISLIVFLVMHAAPGQPGASVQGAGDASQDADKGAENEAYTLFKQQFNLDKPVLFNSRYKLSDAAVLSALEDSLNLSGDVEPGRQIEAKEQLTDWAVYAVPGLHQVLITHSDKSVRSRASKWLSSAAKKRLKNAHTRRPTREQMTADTARMKHNLEIKTWIFEAYATASAEAEVLA
jgi:peptide/nickel transport system permease protein